MNTKQPKDTNNDILKKINEIYNFIYGYIKNIYEQIIHGKRNKKDHHLDVDDIKEKCKENIGYIFLVFEIYCMLFHTFLVRAWIFLNFMTTLLFMYNSLNNNRITDRAIPIGEEEIKKISIFVVGYGVMLLLFFTTTVGILTIPLILYLLNRTMRNVFKKGF